MLDKFAIIEEKLNWVLSKLLQFVRKLIIKIVPTPIQTVWLKFIRHINEVTHNTRAVVNSFFVNSALFISEKFVDLKLKRKEFAGKVDETKKIGDRIKAFFMGTPVATTKKFLNDQKVAIRIFIKNHFNQEKFDKFAPRFLVVSLLGLGIFSVVKVSHNIYRQENPYRKPASIQVYDEKPKYHFFQQQTVKIQNIKVPLQATRVGKMDSLTIDFSVRTSTRFASYFISENEHKLKDYFFTAVEPIVSDFALDEDGKEVLKEKIQKEIQRFLDKEKVRGEVLEVHLLYVIGS